VDAVDAAALRPCIQEIGPRPWTRKRKIFSTSVVIYLVGTTFEKIIKIVDTDAAFCYLVLVVVFNRSTLYM